MQKSNKKLKYGFLLKCWKIQETAAKNTFLDLVFYFEIFGINR
jgi:hypothetical protein